MIWMDISYDDTDIMDDYLSSIRWFERQKLIKKLQFKIDSIMYKSKIKQTQWIKKPYVFARNRC
jgi:hypothetical protein